MKSNKEIAEDIYDRINVFVAGWELDGTDPRIFISAFIERILNNASMGIE